MEYEPNRDAEEQRKALEALANMLPTREVATMRAKERERASDALTALYYAIARHASREELTECADAVADIFYQAHRDKAELPRADKVAVVEVYGGVADVTVQPYGVRVEIVDHDNLESE